MQRLRFISGLMIVTMIFLNSCGGSSTKNNEFLGELPSIEKIYEDQLDEKEKEIKECTDNKKANKLKKEKELLKEEKKNAVAEYIATNPLNKDLPFQALDNTSYTIKKVVVDKATAGNLNIKFLITINEEMKNKYGSLKQSLFVYFKALDSEGNHIANSTTVATSFARIDLVAGAEYEALGTWQGDAIRNMEDFAKIVEITKEEYEEN
jgi:hypothetical protein